MKQTAQIATILPKEELETIRTIANLAYPKLWRAGDRFNAKAFSTVQENSRVMDCPTYSKFLHVFTLKASEAFMNAKDVDGKLAQVHEMNRCSSHFLTSSFECNQQDILPEMYKDVVYALHEKKGLDFTMLDDWPQEMHKMETSALKCTVLDKNLIKNQGINDALLETFLTFYQRHYLSKVKPLLSLKRRKIVETEVMT